MSELVLILQILVNGIIAGAILSLVAIGYNMIYGILKFINFAHGDVVTFSSFIFFFFFVQIKLPIYLSVILAVILTLTLSMAMNHFIYKKLRSAPKISLLVAAISLSLIIQAAILMSFGADVKIIPNPFSPKPLEFFGVIITSVQIAIIFVSVFLCILLEIFLQKTTLGKQIRATSADPELAKTIGIDTEKTIADAFAISSLLATVAAIMISFEQPINYYLGFNLGVNAFAASIIGGIGSIYGSFLGAYFISILENLGLLFLPSGYKDAIGFLVLAIFLLFRPNGIIHNKSRKL
ncbi:MAG: branched-chain amino acid ABC transporter permease [Candidatus Micrarchaeota archaeon]